MKTSTCILSGILLFVLLNSFEVSAQMYVSGGIYANTTWTLANSPYIVTSDVVVFPGITLTIEPGVVIKFDNATALEIRQATLVAAGTSTYTITFTSNDPNPVQGIWGNSNGGIWINGNSIGTMFNHCIIEYATTGVNSSNIAFIKNSVFNSNNEGIRNVTFPFDSCLFTGNATGIDHINGTMSYCTFKHNTSAIVSATNSIISYCTLDSNTAAITEMSHSRVMFSSVKYNATGIRTYVGVGSRIEGCVINYNSNYGVSLQTENDTVSNCEFFNNAIGLSIAGHYFYGGSVISNSQMKYNTTGISISSNFSIPCFINQCEVENNTIGISVSNTLVTISCNSICNNTSYNLAMGVPVNFNVAGNEWCTSDSASTAALILDGYDSIAFGLVTFLPIDTMGCSPNTGISFVNELNEFTVYPNPASSFFTIRQSSAMQNADLKIFNAMGEIVYRDKTGNEEEHICRPNLIPGYYTIHVNKNNQSSTRSLVIMK